MLDQSKTWAEGGHVPAWLPFRDSDDVQEADAAVATTRRPPTPPSYDPEGWYSGSGSNFEIIIGSAIGAVVAGQLTPRGRAGPDAQPSSTTLADTASPI